MKFSAKSMLVAMGSVALLSSASSASAQVVRKVQAQELANGGGYKIWLRFAWSSGASVDSEWVGSMACCYKDANPSTPMRICTVGHDGRPYIVVPYGSRRLNISFRNGYGRIIWTGWFDVEY